MELVAQYMRVIGFEIHQAQITACALAEEADGSARIEPTAIRCVQAGLAVGGMIVDVGLWGFLEVSCRP